MFYLGIIPWRICWHPHIPISVIIITSGKSSTSGSLWAEHFQPSLGVLGEVCISFSCISSLSSAQVSCRRCCRSAHIYNSSCTLFDGGSMASQNSQLDRHFPLLSYHRRSHQGCISRHGAPGSAITALIPLAAQEICCTDKGSSRVLSAIDRDNSSGYS